MSSIDPNFRTFLDAAPDAIVVVDREGRIIAINTLTEQMFGYRSAELLTQPVEVLIPERFRPPHREDRSAYSRAPRTRPMGRDRQLWGLRKSGQEFPVQVSLSPMNSGGETYVTSIIRDVTRERAAEERFRQLLESAPDGIVVVDAAGVIVMVNSQTERLFGYTRQELIGQPVELLVPERARDNHRADRRQYSDEPRLRPMGAGRRLTGRTKAGDELPVEISLSPLVTDQGRLVMSTIRDITERRKAEEIIRSSLREKEALLKEIHHRVKNNLQVTSSLLRLQAAAIDDPSVRAMFAETEDRIQSMALVHEKLYQSTNLSRIDFADYVRSLGALLLRSSAIDAAGVTLEVSGRETLLSIDVAVPCGLIVNELLSNSLKHAFPEGRHGRITVHLGEREDGWRAIHLRDDGIGLPAEPDLSRKGTLGLRLVHSLAQQIEGNVVVESSRGGASFLIAFPSERGH